jgi:hypothetical protein
MKIGKTHLLSLFLLLVALCNVTGCQGFSGQGTLVPATMEPTVEINPFLTPPAVKPGKDDVLTIAWFKQPYTGVLDTLRLQSDNQINLWHVIANWATQSGGQGYTQLAENEVQEVKTLLAKLANSSPTHPEDSMIISVSFPLNHEIQFMTFGVNCPSDLRRIFEIVETAFARDGKAPGKWIPCQN